MYTLVGKSFGAEAGIYMFSEIFHIREVFFLAGRGTRRGVSITKGGGYEVGSGGFRLISIKIVTDYDTSLVSGGFVVLGVLLGTSVGLVRLI